MKLYVVAPILHNHVGYHEGAVIDTDEVEMEDAKRKAYLKAGRISLTSPKVEASAPEASGAKRKGQV